MTETERLKQFIEVIKTNISNDLEQLEGLSPESHRFITHTDNHDINFFYFHSTVIFESIPLSKPNEFENALRIYDSGTIEFNSVIPRQDNPRVSRVDSWTFEHVNTEEELFQKSTILDYKELTLDMLQDIQNLKNLLIDICSKHDPIN